MINKKEYRKAYNKQWRKSHIERWRQYNRNWRKRNVERVKKYNAEYYRKNLEKRKRKKEEWRIKNMERYRRYNRLKRLRFKKLGGFHSLKEWEDLKKKYNYCCVVCWKKEPFLDQKYQCLTEDHIIPAGKSNLVWLKWKGEHPEVKYKYDDIENIQPLCHRCNAVKNQTLDKPS